MLTIHKKEKKKLFFELVFLYVLYIKFLKRMQTFRVRIYFFFLIKIKFTYFYKEMMETNHWKNMLIM